MLNSLRDTSNIGLGKGGNQCQFLYYNRNERICNLEPEAAKNLIQTEDIFYTNEYSLSLVILLHEEGAISVSKRILTQMLSDWQA